MAGMLRDSTVAAVVRTRLRATPLAMITMRKSTHGFPFVSHIWDAYGARAAGAPLLTQVVRTQRKTLFKELAFKHLTSTFVSLTEEFQ